MAKGHPSTRVRASGGAVLTVTADGRRRLREARNTAGLTQRSLADGVGCSQTFIWQLESGRRDRISVVLATAIAENVGIPVAALVGAPSPMRHATD